MIAAICSVAQPLRWLCRHHQPYCCPLFLSLLLTRVSAQPVRPQAGRRTARRSGLRWWTLLRGCKSSCGQPTLRPALHTSYTLENSLSTGMLGSDCAYGLVSLSQALAAGCQCEVFVH